MNSKSYRFNSAGRIVRRLDVKMRPKLKPEESHDFSKLQKLCTEYIDAVDDDESLSDFNQYIFSEAIQAFYGEDVFDWVNEKT